MSKYILVPVEKLKEWEATINTIALQTAFDIADDIAQYSYAPAVQGEPVGYVNSDEMDNMMDDRTATIHPIRTGFHATPLYLAPQPAVQGEPVGVADSLHGASGFTAAVFESSKVPEGTKLYAAPQTAPEESLSAADYEEVLADHRRLARELDVLLNGEEGAAKQASLCDLVAQLRTMVRKTGKPVMASPDVGVLIEALELISDTDPDEGTAWFHEIAYKALATHQGRESK